MPCLFAYNKEKVHIINQNFFGGIIMDYDFQMPQREEREEYRNRFRFTDEDAPLNKKNKEKTKTDYFIRLILIQSFLSFLIVSGVFVVSEIAPNLFAQMKEDYGQIMQTDMSAGDIAGQLKEAAEFVLKPVNTENKAETAMSDNILTTYEVTSDETGEKIAVGEIVDGSGGDDIESAKGTSFADYLVNANPVMPVQGARITSRFGYRTHPITGKKGFHTGLDLAISEGTPISAVYFGKVTKTGEDDSWGKYVLVEHSDGFETFYCHLSEIYAEKGAVIRQGETVGLVGSTGMSTGPHLHFEVRINGIRVDPEILINADEA